jgi:CheY-like chemotaxis protein
MALTCLIVDDNPGFLRAAQELLSLEGLAVVGVAATGVEAVSRVAKLRPDVVLIDLNLGSESGFDLARVLAADPLAAQSARILISSRAEDELAELIEESPALGFLAKPDLSAEAIRKLVLNGRRS